MMKFIFNENSVIGIYPIKYFHIVWYDKDNECFDEEFIEPENFNHGDLTYAFVDDERNSDEEYSRVFAVTIDGKEYELKFERRNKNGMFTVGIKQVIDEMPTADVVEIVRCKDCSYFRPYEQVEDFDGECIAHEIETDKTEFCSIGCKSKRKDVEELMNDKL